METPGIWGPREAEVHLGVVGFYVATSKFL